MGSIVNPHIPLSFLFLLCSCLASITISAAQRNIEAQFPALPSPAFLLPPLSFLSSLPPSPSPPPPPPPSSSEAVAKAVVATATGSFALCGLIFFAFQCATRRCRLREEKVVLVEEDGSGAANWREFRRKRCCRCSKELLYSAGLWEEDKQFEDKNVVSSERIISSQRIQERPLVHAGFAGFSSRKSGDSRSSSSLRARQQHLPPLPSRGVSLNSRRESPSPQSAASPAPLSPDNASSSRGPSPTLSRRSSLSQLPPAVESKALPLPHAAAAPAPPPPPPPPPPPKTSAKPLGFPSVPAAPPPPASARAAEAGGARKRLKPLHWDKMNPRSIEHSMVWDRITNGSFRVDEDIMEALFGAGVDNRAANAFGDGSGSSSAPRGRGAAAQICLLDPRRSQNVSIVLRSLTVSHQDILDGILHGHSISCEALERLAGIALTKEEENLIREYSGSPSKLAHAESFLFDILRAVPVAPFARLEALFFQASFKAEVAQLEQSLHTLERACGELKNPNRCLFLKLLEAVLKAGNRMNAGTMRGNAHAFNLTALLKLSDVKSTDGSTTLLHFVVEEVVRAEGKRLLVSRNGSLDRPASRWGREEREREYTMLGLPVVGGLSEEFHNLKRAAATDFDVLVGTCMALQGGVGEIGRLLETCGDGGFAREMKSFVERAENELKRWREEQVRVLGMVKRTTEYYHGGGSNEKGANPLQLFMVVKNFLEMVDMACVDITRNLQKKKEQQPSGSAWKTGRREAARFPNLPPHFLDDNSRSDSDSSDGD